MLLNFKNDPHKNLLFNRSNFFPNYLFSPKTKKHAPAKDVETVSHHNAGM